MDLYVHNTCIEFKTNILKACILTDGVHYLRRQLSDEKLPLPP